MTAAERVSQNSRVRARIRAILFFIPSVSYDINNNLEMIGRINLDNGSCI